MLHKLDRRLNVNYFMHDITRTIFRYNNNDYYSFILNISGKQSFSTVVRCIKK